MLNMLHFYVGKKSSLDNKNLHRYYGLKKQ